MNRCPVDGCGKTTDYPICRLHYFMLPVAQRRGLNNPNRLAQAIGTIRALEGSVTIIYSCVL